MVMSTMPIKYAVPAGSARTRLLTACAARYTGCTVRGWDVWDGLGTHPASQNSGRFGYSFGKTRIIVCPLFALPLPTVETSQLAYRLAMTSSNTACAAEPAAPQKEVSMGELRERMQHDPSKRTSTHSRR